MQKGPGKDSRREKAIVQALVSNSPSPGIGANTMLDLTSEDFLRNDSDVDVTGDICTNPQRVKPNPPANRLPQLNMGALRLLRTRFTVRWVNPVDLFVSLRPG
jgi:hypothetical protein